MADFVSDDGYAPVAPGYDVEPLRLLRITDDTHLNCPVLNKDRTFLAQRGICHILEYQLRDRQGNPVNICGLTVNEGIDDTTPPPDLELGQVIWRFRDAFGTTPEVHQIIGWAHDCERGIVRAEMSAELSGSANIYRFNIGVTDGTGYLQTMDQGLLSVEPSLFVDVDPVQLSGPITLNEVRMALRDTMVENDLHDVSEFSDSEIVFALVQPIQQWNETPPGVVTFTAHNFPFRHHWLQATVAQLLRISAHWYRRNKMQSSQGGITIDDRNKDQAYLQVAMAIDEDWKKFIRTKKIELNIMLASGSINSTYGYGWF